jgi:hypothetical protein
MIGHTLPSSRHPPRGVPQRRRGNHGHQAAPTGADPILYVVAALSGRADQVRGVSAKLAVAGQVGEEAGRIAGGEAAATAP